MGDHLVVKVLEALEQLIHDILGFSLADSAARPHGMAYVCKQIATRAKLQEDMAQNH
jgi:hypothetical protein